ncbi:MAG: hypothetical protein ACX94B_03840 [Henriciella sp.]
MSLILLIATTLGTMLGAHRLNHKFWRRRHGEIRPSSAWFILGTGLVTFFGTFGLFGLGQASAFLSVFTLTIAGGGAAMIWFYFHKRFMFRRRALYEVKRGRVTKGVPYVCAWQCQLGRNIERDGLIIQGVGARTWTIPGATSRQALSEALWCLKDAGVKLPEEEALVKRFGITSAMIEHAAR